jgi:hypothetical protein
VDGAKGETGLNICTPHRNIKGWSEMLFDAAASNSQDFATRTFDQLSSVLQRYQKDLTAADLNAGLAVVGAVNPTNEIETMLAVQMAATHDVAMEYLARSKHDTNFEHTSGYAGMATKLMRTFTAQVEALAKLRRGGEQTVRVEHVHVHPSGLAIVGNVTRPGGGGETGESRNQPMHPLIRKLLPLLQAPRCCATTRRGTPCQSPAVKRKTRCRMHGGARKRSA